MRWYKHVTNSHNDEKLAEILHDLGLEGYGFWWLLLEIVGKEMDASDRCDLSYPLATWARKLHCSKRKTSMFLQKFSEISLIFLEFPTESAETSIGKLKVNIPNLLKYRDEYSKKSGQTPDKKPKDSGAKIEIETQIEIKDNTTLSASLDAEQETSPEVYITAKKRRLTGERLKAFNQFMDVFGDKRGRAQAADAWIDTKLSRAVFEQIMVAAEAYAKQRPRMVAENRTPKMAQGWISGRRWEDEPSAPIKRTPELQL